MSYSRLKLFIQKALIKSILPKLLQNVILTEH